MQITINEELRKYIDPLTDNERAALERSILAEGCRDALVLWGEVLIDGHNRYEICQQHGIAFNTVQNNRFSNLQDVMLWMIDNQLSRRSVTDFQRGMLALRKKELVATRTQAEQVETHNAEPETNADDAASAPTKAARGSRQEVAKIAGVSSHTIGQIEKIQKTAAPELIKAVRAGDISISAAAAVASLSSAEQVAAVAGGKKELQLAARQVRQTKTPVKQRPEHAGEESVSSAEPATEVEKLQSRIAELEQENVALKTKIAHLSIALAEARRAD